MSCHAMRCDVMWAYGGGEQVPDTEYSTCMICSLGFSLVHRRHHCRSCGWLVCAACVGHVRLLSRWFANDGSLVDQSQSAPTTTVAAAAATSSSSSSSSAIVNVDGSDTDTDGGEQRRKWEERKVCASCAAAGVGYEPRS